VAAEEEYLISIFGQEYLDYMSHTPRFIPWG
jgi:protein-S-isoprenylcysteine O-methyltransferase Ste14